MPTTAADADADADNDDAPPQEQPQHAPSAGAAESAPSSAAVARSRSDVTAACCVAACILSTGGLPSARAIAAARAELSLGWALRARRLPLQTAADTIEHLAPLRESVRVADIVDAVRDAASVPQPAADARGRSQHSFRDMPAVLDALFRTTKKRVLLWEAAEPCILLAALADGRVWVGREPPPLFQNSIDSTFGKTQSTDESTNVAMKFECFSEPRSLVDWMRAQPAVGWECALASPCAVIELN